MTGLLVRSSSTNWVKGSVLAIDAGTHLAAVVNIIEEHLPNAVAKEQLQYSTSAARPSKSSLGSNGRSGSQDIENSSKVTPSIRSVLATGPFAGFELPHTSAKANAAYIVRNLITTYLITHPHLDHISGFVINTAGFQHTSRPKRLAGLPSTIDAFKTHIFNDVIWPNLSDEDGGVGLVSYMRLTEGGNLAIGEGEGRGYIEVCDSLAVKSWSISHGKCMRSHGTYANGTDRSRDAFHESSSRRPSQNMMTPTAARYTSPGGPCVTDSSAFFLRDDHSGNELLFFGDVEPDSLSLHPRTAQVWSDAAPKVVTGILKGIFIECSYDESQSDDTLFGHLSPRHIIEELQVLAQQVIAHREREAAFMTSRKRKRLLTSQLPSCELERDSVMGGVASTLNDRRKRRSDATLSSLPIENMNEPCLSVKANDPSVSEHIPESLQAANSISVAQDVNPLKDLQIIIIHVKDNLRDGPEAGNIILTQLEEKEKHLQLGCSFFISQPGSSVWL